MAEPIMVNAGRTGARSNRRQQVLIGILVVIALGALASKVLFNGGGGESVDDSFPTPPVSTPDVSTDSGPAESGFERVAGPRTGRNPFTPLIAPAPAEPVAPPAAEPQPEPALMAAPMTPAPPVVRSFTLVDVYTDGTGIPAAKVRIDEFEIDVYVGQDFAESYRTLSLERDERCGVFLYGDRRFSLCAGETTQT